MSHRRRPSTALGASPGEIAVFSSLTPSLTPGWSTKKRSRLAHARSAESPAARFEKNCQEDQSGAKIETMAGLVHELFLPITGVSIVLSLAWRLLAPGRLRTLLQIVGSVLFFGPQVAVLALWNQSIRLVLHQEALLALWVIALTAVLALRLAGWLPQPRRHRAPNLWSHPLAVGALTVMGTVGAVVTTWTFMLDAFAPSHVVDGVVECTWKASGPRHIAVHRYGLVNGQRISLTADVFAEIHPGDTLRGALGAGSGMLLRLER